MLNKIMLIGNLGADPEIRHTNDGTCVCNLRLATTEKFKGRDGNPQEKTEWHRIVLWGRLGEIASQYLQKGARIYIEGKIETRKWKDKDGKDRYSTDIRANEMKMLGDGQASPLKKASKPSEIFNGDFDSNGYAPDTTIPF